MEYSSNAKGNLGVTLGAIGTGLSAFASSGALDGVFGGGSAKNYVTKDEAAMMQELAAKDSQIALLQAEQASEIKMTEVYKQAHEEIAALRVQHDTDIKDIQKEINLNRREQDAWNANQSVINSQMSAAIATNTNSIAGLQDIVGQITQTKIPNTAVCPGWGNVNISPASSGGTTL